MFLLISGGLPESNEDKIVFEMRDFEQVSISKEMRSFVEECLNVDPNLRPSVQQLERHVFMQGHKLGALQKKVQFFEEKGEESINCYKLQISCVMDEIVHRHFTFNTMKLKLVEGIEDDFIKAMQHERYASADANLELRLDNQQQANTVQFKVVRELIKHQLDSFETERLLAPLPVYED